MIVASVTNSELQLFGKDIKKYHIYCVKRHHEQGSDVRTGKPCHSRRKIAGFGSYDNNKFH